MTGCQKLFLTADEPSNRTPSPLDGQTGNAFSGFKHNNTDCSALKEGALQVEVKLDLIISGIILKNEFNLEPFVHTFRVP